MPQKVTSKGGLSLAGCAEGWCSCLKPLFGGGQSGALTPRIKGRIPRCSLNTAIDIRHLLICPDPGRCVARSYKTVELLGQGGYGSVYRVRHVTTCEDRAIKVIKKPTEERSVERLLTEVQLLIQLDHPNILRLHEYFEDPTSIYLVTELCTGGDLGDLNAELDNPEVIQLLFRDVVGAIAYCHDQGIAHRDLKLENVLLSYTDGARLRRTAKVIDFGLSAIREVGDTSEEWMDDQVGTIYYVAPEVVNGSPLQKYGFKCDMWSIGVMLYIIFTAQHPFLQPSQGREEVRRAIFSPLRTSPLVEAGVDADAQDLLKRLLEREPQRRFSAREVLGHAWLRQLAAEPTVLGSRSCSRSGRTPRVSVASLQSYLNRAHSFLDFTRLEKAVLTLAAYKAKAQEVRGLRAAFASLDLSGAGWLTHEDFKTALEKRGVRLPPKALATVIKSLDPDRDGKIQYTDWLAATLEPSVLSSEQAMREVFSFFDLHGQGKVSAADLQEILGGDVAKYFRCPAMQDKEELDWDDFRALMLEECGKVRGLRNRISRKIRWSMHLGSGA